MLAAALLFASTPLGGASAVAAECGTPPWQGVGSSPDARAQAVVAAMTLDQKIAQVHGDFSLGDFRLVPGIPELCIPDLTVTNGPAGVGPGPEILGNVPATALPPALLLAATFEPKLAKRYGRIQGAEMRDIGRNLLEAPDVDIARTPLNGRTFEAYGEDPWLVSRIGVKNIRAIQSHGIIAMAKHYVVNNQETLRFTIDVVVDERTLREIYLPSFKAAVVEAGVSSIMCSYNRVNGPHSCENDVILNQILKGEWGFNGFVQSDFGASKAGSALAGMDLEMPFASFFGDVLKDAVVAGDVSESRIDDMLVRRYREMFRFGIFTRKVRTSPIPAERHARIAQKIGAAGTVLLRNEGGLLPLNPGTLSSIAVVGPWSTMTASGAGAAPR